MLFRSTPLSRELRSSWPRCAFPRWRAARKKPEVLEPPPPPPLSAVFTASVTAGAVAKEAGAPGSGVEAARHEAAQARSLARVRTVRAGPGGEGAVSAPSPSPSPARPAPQPTQASPPHGGTARRILPVSPLCGLPGALPCAGHSRWRGPTCRKRKPRLSDSESANVHWAPPEPWVLASGLPCPLS